MELGSRRNVRNCNWMAHTRKFLFCAADADVLVENMMKSSL
jgi:hypothetical protein